MGIREIVDNSNDLEFRIVRLTLVPIEIELTFIKEIATIPLLSAQN